MIWTAQLGGPPTFKGDVDGWDVYKEIYRLTQFILKRSVTVPMGDRAIGVSAMDRRCQILVFVHPLSGTGRRAMPWNGKTAMETLLPEKFINMQVRFRTPSEGGCNQLGANTNH